MRSGRAGGVVAMFLAVVSAGVARAAQPAIPMPSVPMRALVIDVEGRAQWRPSASEAWADAKVDDVLQAGAEIRTGLRSSVTMRVGLNATVRVQRSSRLTLPVIVQDGEVLRTRVALPLGMADFKVDVIGLQNDFEVLVPGTTLAVRGTGFAVRWGALAGVQVEALSAEVHAIEVRYLASRLQYLMAARQASSDVHPDPALDALYQTFVLPMPVLTAEEYTRQLSDLGYLESPTTQQLQRIVNGLEGNAGVEQTISTLSPELQLVCNNLNEFFGAYMTALNDQLGFNSFGQIEQFDAMVDSVAAFCQNLESVQGDAFQQIVHQVDVFCHTYRNPTQIQQCESLFHDLIKEGLGH